jgi:hypothetical protein
VHRATYRGTLDLGIISLLYTSSNRFLLKVNSAWSAHNFSRVSAVVWASTEKEKKKLFYTCKSKSPPLVSPQSADCSAGG